MIDYTELWHALDTLSLASWQASLQNLLEQKFSPRNHGDLAHWQAILARLPVIRPSVLDLSQDCLQIGLASDCSDASRQQIKDHLQEFHPWRKGPFCLFGIHLDSEWRSDWKWQRIAPHLALQGKTILDVGCGNGYYGWRMLGAGASLVIGIDPTMRYVMQYAAMQHYIDSTANHLLPLQLEELPAGKGVFDQVFSMGVLYHRRNPLEHLERLRGHLKPGGELLLEGLVLAGSEAATLHPAGRYAKMKNVHALPSVPRLQEWLEQAGFVDVRLLDVTATGTAEQRRTEWMHFESLADFLHPDDPGKTVEGHPAPLRACLLARRPE